MGVKNKKSSGQAAKGGQRSLQEHQLLINEEEIIMNHVALTGNISREIQLHTTGNDNNVTTIHIAVPSDYFKSGEEVKPDFIPVTAWENWPKPAPPIL